MLLNPLTYGVEALRSCLFPSSPTEFSLPVNFAVTGVFCVLTFAASWLIVNRRTNRPAALEAYEVEAGSRSLNRSAQTLGRHR